MGTRLELDAILREVLQSNFVYFQPPAGYMMSYPCIVYSLSDVETKFADNRLYSLEKAYLLTVIDRNPDTLIPEKLLNLPKCSFERFFTADNLNHYVLEIYF